MAETEPETLSAALVTGATGFIGRALVARLVAGGRRVVAISRHRQPPDANVEWRVGEVADQEFVERLIAEVRPATVFHLAGAVSGTRALDAVVRTLDANLVASVNVLHAATVVGCERVVLIGSGDQPTHGEAPCSPYAAAKWAMHGYARMFHQLYDTPVTTARPFMVYGPAQPDESKLVPYVITSVLRGSPPKLSSGSRGCDWVYIDDVTEGLLKLEREPNVLGELVDLGTGMLHPVRAVVDSIVAEMGSSIAPVFAAVADRPAETEFVADAERTSRLCGWTARTPLEVGIRQTVEWYARRESAADRDR